MEKKRNIKSPALWNENSLGSSSRREQGRRVCPLKGFVDVSQPPSWNEFMPARSSSGSHQDLRRTPCLESGNFSQ